MGKFIGLTGNFGCGKSTVATMFQELGAGVIDADLLNRDILQNDKSIQKKIVSYLGTSILKSDGSIDKMKLAETIFTSVDNRKKVEEILHPAIRQLAQEKAKYFFNAGKETVIFEATLLIESGYYKNLDGLILVVCDPSQEHLRFNKNPHKQKLVKYYDQIIASQMREEEKKKYAHWIIDNSQSENATQKQVKKIWTKLTSI